MSSIKTPSAPIPFMCLLVACAVPVEMASPQIALSDENFYSHIDAGLMALSEANLWVSLAECGDIGVVAVESDSGLLAEQATRNAAESIDRELKRMGSNTYAVQNMEWLDSGSLALKVKTLICSD